MVREVDPIGEDVTLGTASPDPETTFEALIKAHNNLPRDTDLGVGDLLQWDGSKLVKVDVSAAVQGDLLTVQADGTVAPQSGAFALLGHTHQPDVEVVGGLAWHDAASATPDTYQALNAAGGDAGALTGNTGYSRQTDVRPVNPFPQSKMRRCVLADDGETVAYYLDCDDSTLKAGDWLRIHEGVNDPVTPVPGQSPSGSATLRQHVVGWDDTATYKPGARVLHDGALWEALVETSDEPASGAVAASLDGTDGQVMVEVPRFYVWSDHGSGRHAWEIACSPDEVSPFPDLTDDGAALSETLHAAGRSFTVHPAFQKAGVERTHRYIGAYRAHDNAGTLQTVSGQTYTASLTRDAFRTRIRARNAGLTDPSGAADNVWHLLDWDLWAALQLLLLTEYRTFHSQDVLGGGNTSGGDYAKTTGRANGIGNASGVYDATGALEVPTTGDHDGVAWRGIEDLFGSMWVWVDGWNGSDRDYLRCGTPADFADDTAVGYTSVATAQAASASYPDSIADGLHFIPATVAGSSSTFVPDGHWNNSGWRVALVGSHASAGVLAGAFAAAANNGSGYAYVSIGAIASR